MTPLGKSGRVSKLMNLSHGGGFFCLFPSIQGVRKVMSKNDNSFNRTHSMGQLAAELADFHLIHGKRCWLTEAGRGGGGQGGATGQRGNRVHK